MYTQGREEQSQQGSPTGETRWALDFGRHGRKEQNFEEKGTPGCSVSRSLHGQDVITLREGQNSSPVITKEHIPLSYIPEVLNEPTCRDPLWEEWIIILRRMSCQLKKFTNDWLWKQLLLQGHPYNNFYSPELKNSHPPGSLHSRGRPTMGLPPWTWDLHVKQHYIYICNHGKQSNFDESLHNNQNLHLTYILTQGIHFLRGKWTKGFHL